MMAATLGAAADSVRGLRDVIAARAATNPAQFYNVTLNNGTTNPVWDPANPNGGTFHGFTGADRFNFAPFNLLLTPSQRSSLFTNVSYAISDSVDFHIKALYNNRESLNQAAPEPIFVGPGAGTGGIADTISISRLNPFNPFGIDLNADSNFLFIGRRPLEVGPRVFRQDVDTWYVNTGFEGVFNVGDRTFSWDANYVHSENKAQQVFTNGYNVAKLKLALGDPALCAAVAGCTPLDLFGGQARPFTQQMIDYMLANNPMTEEDATKEVERYIDTPGQALSYKVGMMKILELREKAKKALGAKFDIRDFHDTVLKNGAVALPILEELVDDYIAAKKAA